LETALAYPPPITVELVIGYAHAAWVMLVSTHTTAPEPSVMVGMPGYLAWPLLLAGGVGPLMHDSYEGSAAVQRGLSELSESVTDRRLSGRWSRNHNTRDVDGTNGQ